MQLLHEVGRLPLLEAKRKLITEPHFAGLKSLL